MPASPSDPPQPNSRFSLLYAVLRGCLTGFVVAWALEVGNIFLGPNVHVVADGAVYRSAQLGPADLERVVRRHHIRTVVNLCGCCDPLPWYVDEGRTTCRLGICQEDIAFSACRLPSVPAMRQLVEVLDRCDYPVLLHCHRGIDRTGMAAAAALLLHSDERPEEARRELGLRYCHLAAGKYAGLDHFFDLYERWLKENRLAHSPATFRRWVASDYCPGECRAAITLLEPREGPLWVAAGEPFGLRVRCTNTSVEPWVMQPGSNAGVHLGWILLNDGDGYSHDGRSGLFDAVVPPGGHIDLTVALPPLEAGRYQLQLDMIDEQGSWFYQTGGTMPVALDVEVR